MIMRHLLAVRPRLSWVQLLVKLHLRATGCHCRMGSPGVTCQPTQVNTPHLNIQEMTSKTDGLSVAGRIVVCPLLPGELCAMKQSPSTKIRESMLWNTKKQSGRGFNLAATSALGPVTVAHQQTHRWQAIRRFRRRSPFRSVRGCNAHRHVAPVPDVIVIVHLRAGRPRGWLGLPSIQPSSTCVQRFYAHTTFPKYWSLHTRIQLR